MRKKTTITDLTQVMARLRGPKGCPWDKEQTHQSLLKYLFEEAAEVKKAVGKKDMDNLHEELGDILLQVLFHAQLAKENGYFDMSDVMDTLKKKMVNRHPHVFGNHKGILSADDVRRNWKKLKTLDKKKRQKK